MSGHEALPPEKRSSVSGILSNTANHKNYKKKSYDTGCCSTNGNRDINDISSAATKNQMTRGLNLYMILLIWDTLYKTICNIYTLWAYGSIPSLLPI